MVIDLETEDGRTQLHGLLEGADALIHTFGPAAAAQRGLSDDELAARHPRLITSAVLAWPAGHPSADGPSDDLLVSARLGLCDEQQGWREGPVFLRFPFGSWCAVYLSTIGILARLIQRERGGAAGGPAHTSMAQGALVPTMMHWARAETPGPMFAWGLPKDLIPSMFEAGDGIWIHLMRNADVDSPLMVKPSPSSARREWLRRTPPSPAWPRPGTPTSGPNRVAFRTRPAQEWLEDFWAHDIPAQPSAQYGAILADEQARANGYVTEVDDPVRGPIIQAGRRSPPRRPPG